MQRKASFNKTKFQRDETAFPSRRTLQLLLCVTQHFPSRAGGGAFICPVRETPKHNSHRQQQVSRMDWSDAHRIARAPERVSRAEAAAAVLSENRHCALQHLHDTRRGSRSQDVVGHPRFRRCRQTHAELFTKSHQNDRCGACMGVERRQGGLSSPGS